MKKSDLKLLIKPLVKECIHEVLIEEGLLSNVVAEVAKGLQGAVIKENSEPKAKTNTEVFAKARKSSQKISRHKRSLMESIGADAYNGVNLFEGTEPMAATTIPKAGTVDMGSPADPGVDISSLLGGASEIWQAMK